MSEPTRLLDDNSVDDMTKQLLAAGRNDRLPSKRAAAIAAGLGAGTASAAATAGTAWGIGKVVLALAAVGAIGVGGYVWSQHAEQPAATNQRAPVVQPANPQRPEPSVRTEPPLASVAVAPNALPPTATVPNSPAAPTPTQTPTHKTSATKPAPVVAAPPLANADDLAAEVALLDRANRGLNSQDITAAAAAMSEYRTIFPHGALAAAAAAVEFEIARQRGDQAGAIALGTEFLRRYPSSPLRKRIEARLHELQPQESP